ncbi:MAG: DUF6384 family protein [Planctomycetota bacterium]
MTTNSNAAQQAQAPQPARRSSAMLPDQDLSLNEMLRVMDVAREIRQQRSTAERMFQQDDARAKIREKLMRSAAVTGEQVTEAEVDAAIDQYFANQHTFQAPESGFNTFVAHLWIRRTQVAWVLGTLVVAAAGVGAYFLFG